MADTETNDLIMYLEHSSGQLAAESETELNPADPMTKTFVEGKFFQVESFTISMKLQDDDKAGGSARTYESWRSTQKGAAAAPDGKQVFFAKPDELTVTRLIDSASPNLLQVCLKLEKLKSAVLVKRGRNNLGLFAGFFKLEFTDLSVRSLDWSDSDVIREVCRFRYEKLAVTYNRRKPDGTKMTSWNSTWEPPKNG